MLICVNDDMNMTVDCSNIFIFFLIVSNHTTHLG